MSGGERSGRKPWALARRIWLIYAMAAVSAALILLAMYVNVYDDYDIGQRLRKLGRFTRLSMQFLSFPLGAPVSFLVEAPLERAFGCGDEGEPCAVFVHWQTQFSALLVQVAFFRWLLRRH